MWDTVIDMPSLFQPGTLLLILIGILLIALFAALFYSRTPMNMQDTTQFPPLTLTVYRGSGTDSGLLPIPNMLRTAAPNTTPRYLSSLTASLATFYPLPLHVEAPVCYDSAPRSLVCLGWVHNPSNRVAADVQLRVDLRNARMRTVQSARSTLEQRRILPGQYAPYRVQFNEVREPFSHVNASLKAVSISTAPRLDLEVLNARGILMQAPSERFVITASLINPHPVAARNIQVIATVYDEERALLGYRVLSIAESLPPGENYSVRLEIVPLILNSALSFDLAVGAEPDNRTQSGAEWVRTSQPQPEDSLP